MPLILSNVAFNPMLDKVYPILEIVTCFLPGYYSIWKHHSKNLHC